MSFIHIIIKLTHIFGMFGVKYSEDSMNNYNIYKDIANRTNGNIYVGVVGPVRTGKSTFITKVMEKLVLPNIQDGFDKTRTIDELPQSGSGRLIMTTQPKFIPNEAVAVKLENDVDFKVRLVDCVGYFVDGAIGHEVEEQPRMVSTPWSDDKIPFEKAAELGTNKVISDHSTFAVMMTTDGSISEIARDSYVAAEEKVVKELNKHHKPFVMVLNSTHPNSQETQNLRKSLSDKYSCKVLALNVDEIEEHDIANVFNTILGEFPVSKVGIKLPQWMQILDYSSDIIKTLIEGVKGLLDTINKFDDIHDEIILPTISSYFDARVEKQVDLGDGRLTLEIEPQPELYYNVLSKECGCDIKNEYHLISYIKQLAVAKVQYDKFKDAIAEVNETGYGVVHPMLGELTLEEPKMYKSGGKFGVKLRASAPSLHIMRVDIETEVNSMVGNEQQSEELVKYLMEEFENNPQEIWDTKMFGKSLYSLVNEGLQNKLLVMPQEVQKKMRRTLGRIVNEGKGGVICILL